MRLVLVTLATLLLMPAIGAAAPPQPKLELTLTSVDLPSPEGALGALEPEVFAWDDEIVVHTHVKNVGDADSYSWSAVYLGTMLSGGMWRWTEGVAPIPTLAPGEEVDLTVAFSAEGYAGDVVVRATFGGAQLLSGQPLLQSARTPREALVHVLVDGHGVGTWVDASGLP